MQKSPGGEYEIIVFKDSASYPGTQNAKSQLESLGMSVTNINEIQTSGNVMFVGSADYSEIEKISAIPWVKDGIMLNSVSTLSGNLQNYSAFMIYPPLIVTVLGLILIAMSLKRKKKFMMAGSFLAVIGILWIALYIFSINMSTPLAGFGPGCICVPLGDERLLDECEYETTSLAEPRYFGTYENKLVSRVDVGKCSESYDYQIRGNLYVDQYGSYIECSGIW